MPPLLARGVWVRGLCCLFHPASRAFTAGPALLSLSPAPLRPAFAPPPPSRAPRSCPAFPEQAIPVLFQELFTLSGGGALQSERGSAAGKGLGADPSNSSRSFKPPASRFLRDTVAAGPLPFSHAPSPSRAPLSSAWPPAAYSALSAFALFIALLWCVRGLACAFSHSLSLSAPSDRLSSPELHGPILPLPPCVIAAACLSPPPSAHSFWDRS